MSSGPGTTGKSNVPSDEAIEEISGLLEMDDLKASELQADSADQAEANASHGGSAVFGDALDVSMETPGPVSVDSYPPPPVSDESSSEETQEADSGSSSNMAYEDLLEKLVLPANPAAAEAPPSEVTPALTPSRNSGSSPLANLYPVSVTPGPSSSSDDRTVVTVNPLLAEEQEAAARGAESYILPAAVAPAPLPSFATPPMIRQPVRETTTRPVIPGKTITMTYPIFGVMMLAGVLVGGVISRVMSPARLVVTVPPTQTLVGQPVVPAQVTPPANPAPQVVPLPMPTETPTPAQPVAQPAAVAKPAAAAEPPAAAEEPAAGEPAAAPKPRVHHVAKTPRPPKNVAAKPVAAAKPAAPPKPAAKPSASKKPSKGWTDPFAQ
jgi:hypothetical protein